ncbi:MAG TPA: hypothetical protein VGF25_20400 [Thermoleophilaceae bacterium]|jgi:hypothetical protein
MASWTAPAIPAGQFRGGRRAELVFTGVEQAGPSFEGRVFLNNPGADESTPRSPEQGYAGSFHVFGYGTPEPPAVAEARAGGARPAAPIEKRVRADEAAVGAALEGSDELLVTVVPVPADPGGPVPERPAERVELVLDRA